MPESLMICAYWNRRPEEVKSIAIKITNYFNMTRGFPFWDKWYLTGTSRKKSNIAVEIYNPIAVEKILKPINKKNDPIEMQGLGFSFNIWNGRDDERGMSVMATCGAEEKNAFVIDLGEVEIPEMLNSMELFRQLVVKCIDVFNPDAVIFTSQQYIDRHGGGGPSRAGGWIIYSKNGGLKEMMEI